MQALLQLDIALFWLVNSHHSPALDVVFGWVTHLGSGWVAAPLTLGLVILSLRWSAAVPVIVCSLALTLAGLGSAVLKRAVDRPRPAELFLGQPQGSAPIRTVHLVGAPADGAAFPSGHTTNAFAAAMLLGALLGRRWWWALGVAAAVGCSRIYVGAHFPLDVLAGAALGTAVSLAVVVVGQRGTAWRSQPSRPGVSAGQE